MRSTKKVQRLMYEGTSDYYSPYEYFILILSSTEKGRIQSCNERRGGSGVKSPRYIVSTLSR
jgi:hypothetical protein